MIRALFWADNQTCLVRFSPLSVYARGNVRGYYDCGGVTLLPHPSPPQRPHDPALRESLHDAHGRPQKLRQRP